MKFEEIIQSIQKREYKPIYFLMGEESWFIDQITELILNTVLSESERDFNQTILYGKDTNITQIIMAALRYPMMAPYQVIVVREAQNVEDIDLLESYAEKPMKSTILVFNYRYKTLDKRKKLSRLIEQNGVLFESKRLYDNQLPTWITTYLKGRQQTIDPKASVIVADSVGADLSKTVHELEKMLVALGPSVTHIMPEHVERNIGISKDFNNFELQKAIASKNHFKANQIILTFAKNPKNYPIQATIATLFGFFVKLLMFHYTEDKSQSNVASVLKINPFFVQDYVAAARNYPGRKVVHVIHLLREYDLKSKGFGSAGTEDGDLLKELVFKIMNP